MTPDPFEVLAALACEEHRLVLDGHHADLADVAERRSVVLASLPAQTPPGAMGHLREAARVQALVTLALREARDATAADLNRLARTRTGVQGYGREAPVARSAVDASG